MVFFPNANWVVDSNMAISSTHSATIHAGRFIAILGMLSGFAPLSTNMYLAGFAQMADHFGVSEGDVRVTLSMFFLGWLSSLPPVLGGFIITHVGWQAIFVVTLAFVLI